MEMHELTAEDRSKGGNVSAMKLSPLERSDRARKAAKAMLAKREPVKEPEKEITPAEALDCLNKHFDGDQEVLRALASVEKNLRYQKKT